MVKETSDQFSEVIKRIFRKPKQKSDKSLIGVPPPSPSNVTGSYPNTERKDGVVEMRAEDLAQSQRGTEETTRAASGLDAPLSNLDPAEEVDDCHTGALEAEKLRGNAPSKLEDTPSRRDLWAEAYRQLEEKDRNRLNLPKLDEEITVSREQNAGNGTRAFDNVALSKSTFGEAMSITDIEAMIRNIESNLQSIKNDDKESKWKSVSRVDPCLGMEWKSRYSSITPRESIGRWKA